MNVVTHDEWTLTAAVTIRSYSYFQDQIRARAVSSMKEMNTEIIQAETMLDFRIVTGLITER